ncbi:MAG: gas vesicle protein [Thermoanaerobaculia bacterium]
MKSDRDLSLLETLDHLLDRGVVIAGEATISIGDVDLLYLGLNIVLANVDAIERSTNRKTLPGGGT